MSDGGPRRDDLRLGHRYAPRRTDETHLPRICRLREESQLPGVPRRVRATVVDRGVRSSCRGGKLYFERLYACRATDFFPVCRDYLNNKFAQSNLARGPRRGAVAHERPIGPCGQWRAPIRPQKYPFPWTDRQTPPPTSSLDPSDLRCQTAFGSDPPFFHNALAAGHTDRPRERSRESSMTIGRCATRATRLKN